MKHKKNFSLPVPHSSSSSSLQLPMSSREAHGDSVGVVHGSATHCSPHSGAGRFAGVVHGSATHCSPHSGAGRFAGVVHGSATHCSPHSGAGRSAGVVHGSATHCSPHSGAGRFAQRHGGFPSGIRGDFVELLARTNFSFLMGASHPDEMVLRAKQLGYRGLAICDVNGLYGVVRGYQAAEKPSHFDATQIAAQFVSSMAPPGSAPGAGAPGDYSAGSRFRYHLGSELTPFDASPIVLLPSSKDGYARLSRLITQVKRPAAKGRLKLSLENILEEAGHATGELLAMPLPPWNMKDLEKLADAFGDRLYLPVHKDSTWESIELARQAIQIEKRLGPTGLKLFATQRPLFHVPERKPLHDVLTCLHHGVTIQEAKTRLTLNSERYMRPLEEVCLLYRDRPDLVQRTMEISERLQFSLSELRYKYPQEVLPKGKTSAQYLAELVDIGLERRYPRNQTDPAIRLKAEKQVAHELSLIQDLEYEDYFLTLQDVCQFATSRGILHQGRGSAANSIVCFALGLTAIDPIKLGLLFERFLSRERAEPPDIDIDFEHERREEVIQYIYTKYGAKHAAMVCTTIRYRSRMAIREVAKVMGVTLEQTDLLVKTMGREGLSHLLETPFDVAKFGITEEKFRLILRLALEIKGFPRHLGIHSGGFVISHEPVIDLVPVEAATMTNRFVIQWNKDDVATLGLMKLDILSLGMLSAIRKCFDLLREKKSIDMNLASIPQDDKPTYEMIQKAETIGVFQIESRAQMSLLPRLKPKTWYDLVVQVAIVRPGPIIGGMVHPYLKRRDDPRLIQYVHPRLKPILEKTMGVPIFQEQVMQIVVAVADFTPGEADELRRVVSSAWRKKAVMHGLRQRLVNGMLGNGIGIEYADQIYKVIEGFAEYGFPESHAASFALLTYASCWFKKHHPDVFVISLLNSQPMGFYSPRHLIAEAGRNGVRFRPLDIQNSDWDYTLEEIGCVRIGLRSIDGLSENDAAIIVAARRESGPFQDLEDLVRRTRLPRRAITRLTNAGALFAILPENIDPRRALFSIQAIDFNQGSFFYGTEPLAAKCGARSDETESNCAPAQFAAKCGARSDETESIATESEWETVVREYQTKGFSLDNHPMRILRKQPGLMPRHQRAEDLARMPNGASVKLAGLRSLLQKPPTAKGVCFVSLEDETGIFNLIIMPDVYERVRSVLYASNILEVAGRLQNHKGVIHIKALDVRPFQVPSRLLLGNSALLTDAPTADQFGRSV